MKVQIEPIWRASTQQVVFRSLVQAMSRPGRVEDLSEQLAGEPAYLAVLATLTDRMVTIGDPDEMIDPNRWLLLESRSALATDADYIVANGRRAPSADFAPRLGELSHPERGSTLILEVDAIGSNEGLSLGLRGPGIRDSVSVRITGLDAAWLKRRGEWVRNFPLGVDLLLTDPTQVLAIPRTTTVNSD